jgi:hypothetical protein
MYDSLQYGRVGHYISTLPYCTLSYIISLLFHTVHYLTFYLYSSILYIILHSITTLPYCTLSYITSVLFHTVLYLTLYRDRMYDSVQYGRVEIECKIVCSMEE